MADRGFTIKDMLKELNIELNLPPFMEGRSQLPALQVQKGRKIASAYSCGESYRKNKKLYYSKGNDSFKHGSHY